MARKNGPWTIEQSERKFQNQFLELVEDRVVQPDGKPGSYATVRMKPGVSLLPVDENGDVIITRQFRYALGRESVEAAAGSMDEGESPLQAAQREAREELGLQAEEWLDLGPFDLDTSIVHCPVQLFVARGLTFTETEQEGTETIEILRLPFEQAIRKVMDGEITHGPSCALILKAWRRLHDER